ncbi:cation acetate symporter [Calidifontibacter sp. DB0510]|uniref:Cation acetate symporter n=2 Tax=Metallococcus carri TaxID=1656884 RepID=A0A967B2L8_9MICO|nr:cation acetate symporter [Metallococcus carri]NOP36022.1 cation acetate symporter [Calidifontibacter sp. DB2511S]
MARATTDFYVAGRTVSSWRNASAIGGEFLSAASFLGIASLVFERGAPTAWLPVGYTLGYLVLLVLVAAPLRRSGAYTVPDFAELRLESRAARLVCSALVVAVGWLYALPQLQGAGVVLRHVTGWPRWVGTLVVALVVGANVAVAGMRSITVVQALQYWVKLTAICIPAFVLLAVWLRDGRPAPTGLTDGWWDPVPGPSSGPGLWLTYSTLVALCFGTMGLPHVVVRFYTNPTGREARHTTVAVLVLLGVFYVWTPLYGFFGRIYLRDAPADDTLVLRLPDVAVPGVGGSLLSALLAGGAFAAFLSTTSGLVLSVAGVLDQDVVRPRAHRSPATSFRASTALAVVTPTVVALAATPLRLSTAVGYAFALAAATFAPLIVLGVWWPRLTGPGAIAGMLTGATTTAVSAALSGQVPAGWAAALTEQPALWTVPLATLVSVAVSLATHTSTPPHSLQTLQRLHTPENLSAGS